MVVKYLVCVGIFSKLLSRLSLIFVIPRVEARQWPEWISSWTILLISSDEFSSHSTGHWSKIIVTISPMLGAGAELAELLDLNTLNLTIGYREIIFLIVSDSSCVCKEVSMVES